MAEEGNLNWNYYVIIQTNWTGFVSHLLLIFAKNESKQLKSIENWQEILTIRGNRIIFYFSIYFLT
jgi:hypothetical protein